MHRLNVSCLSCRILLTDVAKKIYVVATGQTGKKGKKKRKKTTAIRRTAVRETGVWWHRGYQLRATLKPLVPSQHSIVSRGLMGALNQSLIVPRDASIYIWFFFSLGDRPSYLVCKTFILTFFADYFNFNSHLIKVIYIFNSFKGLNKPSGIKEGLFKGKFNISL